MDQRVGYTVSTIYNLCPTLSTHLNTQITNYSDGTALFCTQINN